MVVEGGRDTIANIYYDLRANIPVVLIDARQYGYLIKKKLVFLINREVDVLQIFSNVG